MPNTSRTPKTSRLRSTLRWGRIPRQRAADPTGPEQPADSTVEPAAAPPTDPTAPDTGDAPTTVPADPWEAFTPAEIRPGRAERIVDRMLDAGYRVVHSEPVLASAGSLLLAAAATWPAPDQDPAVRPRRRR
jgi:hypothetical protein